MNKQRISPTCSLQLMGAVAFSVFIILFAVSSCTAPQRPPSPGEPFAFRGTNLLLLRNVTQAPYYQLNISDDYTVGVYYFAAKGHLSGILSNEEIQEVERIRKDLCSGTYVHEEPKEGEPFFDLGAVCSLNNVTGQQIKLRPDAIPAVLLQVKSHLKTRDALN
jgi:hypothetical protein